MKKTNIPAVVIPDVLLPHEGTDLQKWAVIACDQYTSEPEYWNECDRFVGSAPSALRIVLPEVKLGIESEEEINNDLKDIASNIDKYISEGIWADPLEGFIITDRATSLHPSRRGIMLAVDLETYDFTPGNKALIRATEGTVLSRIPPRVKIRANAKVELPHIMLLYDDPEDKVISNALATNPEVIYDTDLMQGSGHITGRLVKAGTPAADGIVNDLSSLISADGLLFAVGDGNHSLASAKAHWENVKKTISSDMLDTHPARFALAEAVNIHDKGLDFEPIHRVIFDISFDEFMDKASSYFKANGLGEDGQSFTVVAEGKEDARVTLGNPPHTLAVGSVQKMIDDLGLNCDYIHGEDSVRKLATGNAVGILVPGISKDTFFETIETEGVFPRKTFSMGEAFEKRFYLEARKITL
ncbi:MAG: DUF1015 domain-containing protein [Clostridiales bacterium]|nr:DUF1015 domain-containing protein [Clostridiales bacterium]